MYSEAKLEVSRRFNVPIIQMFSEQCLTLAESKLVKVSLFLVVTVLSNCINIVTWGDHIVNCIAYSNSCKRDIDNQHRIIIASLKLHCIALSLLSPLLNLCILLITFELGMLDMRMWEKEIIFPLFELEILGNLLTLDVKIRFGYLI